MAAHPAAGTRKTSGQKRECAYAHVCSRLSAAHPTLSRTAAAKATDVLIILINLGTAVSYILILSSSSVDLWQARPAPDNMQLAHMLSLRVAEPACACSR